MGKPMVRASEYVPAQEVSVQFLSARTTPDVNIEVEFEYGDAINAMTALERAYNVVREQILCTSVCEGKGDDK